MLLNHLISLVYWRKVIVTSHLSAKIVNNIIKYQGQAEVNV